MSQKSFDGNHSSLEMPTLVIVKPKEAFKSWRKSLYRKVYDAPADNLVFAAEDETVWMFPNIIKFDQSYEKFLEYIKPYKPLMLRYELECWTTSQDEVDWPKNLDVNTFDEFFEIELRYDVFDINQIKAMLRSLVI